MKKYRKGLAIIFLSMLFIDWIIFMFKINIFIAIQGLLEFIYIFLVLSMGDNYDR